MKDQKSLDEKITDYEKQEWKGGSNSLGRSAGYNR